MKKTHAFFIILSMLLLTLPGEAQWAKAYGGKDNNVPHAMLLTEGGDLLVAGITRGGPSSIFRDERPWIMRISGVGLNAQRSLLNSDVPELTPFRPEEQVLSLEPDGDGGYIMAGYMNSSWLGQSKVTYRKYAFLIKLTADLEIDWQRFYGVEDSASFTRAYQIKPLTEGGYVAVGTTTAFGAGGEDLLVMKLDALGHSIWQKTYGGEGDEEARLVCPMPDGGFLVVGLATSFHVASNEQIWVLRLNSEGAIMWQRCFGYSDHDQANAVALTEEGGCWIAGETLMDRGEDILPDKNILLMELDAEGQVVFHRSFGDPVDETVQHLIPRPDGSFLAVGSQTTGEDQDILIMQFAATGHMAWLASFGDDMVDGFVSFEDARALVLGDDEEIYVAGSSSRMGPLGDDLLVLKLTPDGRIPNCGYIRSIEKLPFMNFGALPKDTFVGYSEAENILQSFEFNLITTTVEATQGICASKNNLIRR